MTASRLRAVVVLMGLATTLVAGCGSDDSRGSRAETSSYVVLIESTEGLAVGRVASLVVAVRTPAGRRVLPLAPPELDGAEVLGLHTDVEEMGPASWLHRTWVQVRPLRAGDLVWPETSVVIEAPDGGRESLIVPEQLLEVDSVIGRERPDRQPYGLRRPPGHHLGEGFGLGLLIGGGGVLIGAVAFRRLRPSRQAVARPTSGPAASVANRSEATARAIRALADAMSRLEADPGSAASRAASTLRVFVSTRFGCEIHPLPTEELAEDPPNAVPPACIDELTALLECFDTVRFRPRADGPGPADVRTNLEASMRFVERWTYGAPAR